jgi:hypothetical protein
VLTAPNSSLAGGPFGAGGGVFFLMGFAGVSVDAITECPLIWGIFICAGATPPDSSNTIRLRTSLRIGTPTHFPVRAVSVTLARMMVAIRACYPFRIAFRPPQIRAFSRYSVEALRLADVLI